MKILWLTWKDREHPQAGGAEVVNEHLAQRLAAAGHEVTFIVGGFAGAAPSEHGDGYEIVRLGNRYTVYYRAWRYYRQHLQDWPDLIVDEVNTIPFLAKLYAKQPVVMFFHMLCREIWFYQMVFPFSFIGYLAEPVYLRLLSTQPAIVVSDSTRRDLLRYGFRAQNLSLISEGIELKPIASLSEVSKTLEPTVLAFGAIRAMKRTLHQLRAFELAKPQLPGLKLVIAGAPEGRYGRRVARAVARSPFRRDITMLGRITEAKKLSLLRSAHAILVTAVKEGWGLTVTEAASQGTPAVVYDVDGLRDSVRDGVTGLITPTNPAAMAASLVKLLHEPQYYARVRTAAWEWSREITFDQCYSDFMRAITHVV
jgi:glycosyltransferase involved in cell wall biosynthesis